MGKKERRNVETPATVVTRKNGALEKISGYAAVFDKDSENMGFIERIAPGAFKSALRKSDVRALKNHDPNLIFGRKGKNLKLKEDETGLYYEAAPIDTRNYKEIAEEISAGLLTGQSFSFVIEEEEWSNLDKDTPIRTVTKVKEIFDVGPVTYPAYQDTSVALRSLEAAKKDLSGSDEPENIIITDDDTEFVFKDVEQVKRVYKAMQNLPGADGILMNNQSKPGEEETDNPMIAPDLTVKEIEEKFDKLSRRYKS